MSPLCSHADSIAMSELSAAIAGCEDCETWSSRYVNGVAFVATSDS
jgi:hypothetical protein